MARTPQRVQLVNASAERCRILVISLGELSGVRRSLTAALRRHTPEIVETPNSLRCLRGRYVYMALMALNALLRYGRRYRRYLERTRAAQWARARASERLALRHAPVDAVLALSLMPNHVRKLPTCTYAIFTDHVNLLSKRAPDFGLVFPERQISAAWNRYERLALAQQDLIFVPSRYVKRSVIRDYGVAAAKVHVVGAGPNLDVDCERDGVIKDYAARNVLFVGLDAARKGLFCLLAAHARVRAQFPDAHLDVVGIEGQDGDQVHYHGRLSGEPLKQMFYRAQIFAMPSLREPFGIVFLEAMWSKAVCIGARHSAMPEFIEEGFTGHLVAPQDSAALARRICDLFAQPQRLEQMAEAAYRAARTHWFWDRTATCILDRLAAHRAGSGAPPLEPAASLQFSQTRPSS